MKINIQVEPFYYFFLYILKFIQAKKDISRELQYMFEKKKILSNMFY